MGAVTIQQMADRVEELMQDRMHIKGRDLQAGLRKAGRRLPRKVREAGERLAEAALRAQNPKLLLQIDESAVANDYDVCIKYLSGYNRADKIKGMVLGMTGSIFFSLLVVMGLLLAVLAWRGFL